MLESGRFVLNTSVVIHGGAQKPAEIENADIPMPNASERVHKFIKRDKEWRKS